MFMKTKHISIRTAYERSTSGRFAGYPSRRDAPLYRAGRALGGAMAIDPRFTRSRKDHSWNQCAGRFRLGAGMT
jgi:hypothetical protein